MSVILEVSTHVEPVAHLQCAAVCCSVLQCVAVCCSVLQCVAVCCRVLQCVAVCCSVLQFSVLCCSVLWGVAVCCRVLQCAETSKHVDIYTYIHAHHTKRHMKHKRIHVCICAYVHTRPPLNIHLHACLTCMRYTVCCSELYSVAVFCSVLPCGSTTATCV